MNDNAVHACDVCRDFDAVRVLDRVSLDVARGEFVAIVGPSGCGKTTLLNLICGHDQPTTGTVHRRGAVRMIHQRDGLFPWLTVEKNILLGLHGVKDKRERRSQLLDVLELIRLRDFSDHFPHQLSGGMKQLVELARALAGDSHILLMDEPFSSLDYLERLRMRGELARLLSERPRTVVLVTHDLEEAAQLADRIIVLSPRPARVCRELRIHLPRPRPPTHPLISEMVHEVLVEYGLDLPLNGAPPMRTPSVVASGELT